MLTASMLLAALPALAHHSGAAVFDNTKKLNLKGTVTKVDWTNPHAHFFMDVKDESGKVTNWNFELASPSILIRNGWSRHSLKEGDVVTVTGAQARDNTSLGIAQSIVFPDGHKLSFLSAYEDSK
jgi:DNA/RNA endonuclease YhcR with UshA esterase domain